MTFQRSTHRKLPKLAPAFGYTPSITEKTTHIMIPFHKQKGMPSEYPQLGKRREKIL